MKAPTANVHFALPWIFGIYGTIIGSIFLIGSLVPIDNNSPVVWIILFLLFLSPITIIPGFHYRERTSPIYKKFREEIRVFLAHNYKLMIPDSQLFLLSIRDERYYEYQGQLDARIRDIRYTGGYHFYSADEAYLSKPAEFEVNGLLRKCYLYINPTTQIICLRDADDNSYIPFPVK